MLRPVFAFALFLVPPLNVSAEVLLYDSQGFEPPTFTAGLTPVGQDASNPWLAFGGSPTAFTVQSSMVASGTQAIQGNGGGLNDGSYVWPELAHTPSEDTFVRIQVDIARTLTTPTEDSSPVYAIDIYDFDFNRTSRFGLQNQDGAIRTFVSVPINEDGEIDPEGPNNRSEFFGPSIDENTFVHFDFWMDYENKTVSLTVDGNRLASKVPFRTMASTTLDSAELQVGTFNNVSDDFGYFDDYVVSVVLKGDYNQDNVVDAADYTVWRDALGSMGNLAADGDGSGTIDMADYDVWAVHFGQTIAPESESVAADSAVPEPSSIAALAIATATVMSSKLRRGRIE